MQDATPELDIIAFDPDKEAPAHGGGVTTVRLAQAAADPGPQAPVVTFQPTGRHGPDGVDLDQILLDRPDVLKGYYQAYAEHDPHSHAWEARIGGGTPQDFAAYWYKSYGVAEGYSQAGAVENEAIDVDQLLRDRPDVFQGFFTEYYGPHNDRHSSAWANRVGGETVQDYARYWYVTYGRAEGYTQKHAPPAEEQGAGEGHGQAPFEDPPPADPGASDPGYHLEDPSLDPWNHPAIYGDYPKPPDPLSVGQGLGANDPFG